jgi:hypothetical protein
MTDKPREIFAWVTDTGSDTESLVYVPDGEKSPMPLVSTHRKSAEAGAVFVQRAEAAQRHGAPVRLVRYVEAEVLRTIEP